MREQRPIVHGRAPSVDTWAVVHDWNGTLVYEGPAPVPQEAIPLTAEDVAAGRAYTFEMTCLEDPPSGLIMQIEPTHWRYDRGHKPRWCLLCWVERLYVSLRIAKIEEDTNVTVTVEPPPREGAA